nr:PREDICTED: uncharacterized protein LOC109034279 [Bemisia tabaci]
MPQSVLSKYLMKRVSDHRLAELETLLALSKMKGQVMTVPLGYGKVDPERIGRRRRSVGGKRRDVSERKRSYTSVETNSHK